LVIQQNYTEAYGSVLNSKVNALILIICSVLITLILSFIVSKNISEPIKKLTAIANNVSKGKLAGDFSGKDRKDEVGELTRAIARMAKTIAVAIRRLQKMKER
jgi:methyl-accepting chemotaxis protein